MAESNNKLKEEKFDLATLPWQIHQRLWYMMTLKQHRYWKYLQVRNEYKQIKSNSRDNDESNYGMNTWFALVNTKVSEVLENFPEWSFLPLDDDARANVKAKKLLWDHLWLTSRTDDAVSKIVFDAMKYGTWWGMEYIKTEGREVSVPSMVNGALSFKKELIKDYDDVCLEHIPWDNVYVNNTTLENSTEAIILRHWERDEFISKFSVNPLFSWVSEDNIPLGKRYYNLAQSNLVDEKNYTIVFNPSSEPTELSNIVSVLSYYNKSRDQYIVIANGVWINPLPWDEKMPIPFAHKQIPLVSFTDHYIEDDAYGMGEFDITEGSRALKNSVRSLGIEVIKAQFWFTTVSPTADFDEATIQIGLRNFARVDKEDIGFYAPNINGASLQAMEQKIDEDIIIETGIDFKSQLVSHKTTATQAGEKTKSAQRRINLCLKINAFNFFERLGRLRMSNIEFYYDGKPLEISVKGMNISAEGNVESVNGGYGTFILKPQYTKGKTKIIPIVESLINDSSERDKANYIDFVQFVANMKDAQGAPVIDPRALIEAWRGIMDKSIDIDKLLENKPTAKSPDKVLEEAWLNDTAENAMQPAEQGGWYVPPAQRSWAPVIMPSRPNSIQ